MFHGSKKGYGMLPSKNVGRQRCVARRKRKSTEGKQSYARRKLSQQLAARGGGRKKAEMKEWKEEAEETESKRWKRDVVIEEEKR